MNGRYKCPRPAFNALNMAVVGSRRRSTIADNRTRVSGMPSKANMMQNSLPGFDNGVTWPYPGKNEIQMTN